MNDNGFFRRPRSHSHSGLFGSGLRWQPRRPFRHDHPITRPLRPLAGIAAGLVTIVGMIALAVVAVLTLGIALAFMRGRVQIWRGAFGARPPGTGVGGVDAREAVPGASARTVSDASEASASSMDDATRTGEASGATQAKETVNAAGTRPRNGGRDSYAEVLEMFPLVLAAALALGAVTMTPAPAHAKLLVPMDDKQTDHLKAYGLTYWVLGRGAKAEWLLNYRGGSFLLPDDPDTQREANIRGVTIEPIGTADESAIKAEIADNNMEDVALEKAPRVAVYIPPNTPPWDDAVTLALKYADIPYSTVWDEEVIHGDLAKYDWLHLHHEDFTAQHGKFYAAYHTFPWYLEEEKVQAAMAKKLGFAKATQLKAAVALTIKDFIGKGGFMFGMCSATDTYDIALAADGVDIADMVYDGDAPDPQANRKLDYSRTLAFKDFRLKLDPFVYKFSDIDVTQEASLRGPNTFFTLFDFSAKNDPVPTMLIQDHVNAVPEFLGQSTGFHKARVKSGVLVLGEVEGTDEVKYLHGQFGRGTFTFLGGHDPEDYQHMVGDPPTELSRYKHSPGYRLILNNVLFPAAEKKKQRT